MAPLTGKRGGLFLTLLWVSTLLCHPFLALPSDFYEGWWVEPPPCLEAGPVRRRPLWQRRWLGLLRKLKAFSLSRTLLWLGLLFCWRALAQRYPHLEETTLALLTFWLLLGNVPSLPHLAAGYRRWLLLRFYQLTLLLLFWQELMQWLNLLPSSSAPALPSGEMEYTPTQTEKAQRKEQLILRVEKGEPLAQVTAELGLKIEKSYFPQLRSRYQKGGRDWRALVDRRGGQARKATPEIKAFLFDRKRADSYLSAGDLQKEVWRKFKVQFSVRRINELLQAEDLSSPRGRRPSISEELDNAGAIVLEAAAQETGIRQTILQVLAQAKDDGLSQEATTGLRILSSRPRTVWRKVGYLLFLPLLEGVRRPYDLINYQGQGLKALYGINYKAGPLDQFLGELTQLRVGLPLAEALCRRYLALWYAEVKSLAIYTDFHVKILWSSYPQPKGKVTMLGRIAACTKQLLVNGPEGHFLLGLDLPGDASLVHLLPQLEQVLERIGGRAIWLNIFDREGNSLPLALVYTEAERYFLTLLKANQYHGLDDFELLGEWQDAFGAPELQVADARWAATKKGVDKADQRRFILVRQKGSTELQAMLSTNAPRKELKTAEAHLLYRGRWVRQEDRIQEFVQGANGNANYGYRRRAIPNRTAIRKQAKLLEKVAVTERQLSTNQNHLVDLLERLQDVEAKYQDRESELKQRVSELKADYQQRLEEGRAVKRARQRWEKAKAELDDLPQKCEKELDKIRARMEPLLTHRQELWQRLEERRKAANAVDLTRPMYQRDMEKDQIMLDLQLLLVNLHYFVREHYFGPAWAHHDLKTAEKLLYRKRGRVIRYHDRLVVVLSAYRYARHRKGAEEMCARFNERRVQGPDGRLIQLRVALE